MLQRSACDELKPDVSTAMDLHAPIRADGRGGAFVDRAERARVTESQVALATVTWARTDDEEALLRRTLAAVARAGWRVAVSDAGARPEFTRCLRSLPGFCVSVPDRPGLVNQVRQAFAAAARIGAPYVLYAESDKELFLRDRLRAFLGAVEAADDMGVVLAARSEMSFGTFPPMQRYVEGVVNHLCGERMRAPGDYCYGPFLMPCTLVPELDRVEDDLGWGWRPFVFMSARRRGLRVTHAVGDYPCPPDQREEGEAERIHRLRQLAQNVRGLIS
jgi:hypothetical protein